MWEVEFVTDFKLGNNSREES